MAITYGPELIESVCADCLLLEYPISSPRAFRIFCATAKRDATNGPGPPRNGSPPRSRPAAGGARNDAAIDNWLRGEEAREAVNGGSKDGQ